MLGRLGKVGIESQTRVQKHYLEQGERSFDVSFEIVAATGGELPEAKLQVLIVGAEKPLGLKPDLGVSFSDPAPIRDVISVEPGLQQALEVSFLGLPEASHECRIAQEGGRDGIRE